MNKSLEKSKDNADKPKTNFKGSAPQREGSFHGEVHEHVHVNGQRIINNSATDSNTGDSKYFRRKVDNKVKTTHVWDSKNKKWNHSKTEHTLGGLGVDGTLKTSTSHATSMDVARKKAQAAEAAKNTPKESVKPKTITRKAIKKCEDLLNKLKELKKGMDNSGLGGLGSVKSGMVKPSLPKPTKPGNNSATPSVNVAQPSKKNPIKIAEQTHNKDIKDIKMKEAQAQMKAPEMIKFEKNGQWSIEKSGYKGYTEADNVKRKLNNVGETTGIHTMNSIKQYGGSGVDAAYKEAKDMRRKSKKNPVKIFTPEEIAAYNKDNKE